MLKRLKQLDAGALLGQLPRTIDFKTPHGFLTLWDKDGHGTSMAALTDDHPGLIRHVRTRREEEDQQKSVDFGVEGTVNACITLQVGYSVMWQTEYITEILVKIVEVS
jgi:hypothetical protein